MWGKEIPSSEFNKVADIGRQWFSELVKRDIIKAEKKGNTYYLDDYQGFHDYISYLRESSSSPDDLEKEKLLADIRIKKAKAAQEELALKELQGEMHRAEYVEQMTEQFMLTVRSMLMAMPGRVAVDIASMDSAEEISIYMREEVNQIFDGLADFTYDPDAYAKLVRENKGWRGTDESGDEES